MVDDSVTLSNESIRVQVDTVDFFDVCLSMESINADAVKAGLVDESAFELLKANDTQKINIELPEYGLGSKEKEAEYGWVCKIVDAEFLSKSTGYVDIEQWGFFVNKTESNKVSAKQRVRKTTDKNGNVEYVLTIKTKLINIESDNYSVRNEYNIKINETMFNIVKFMSDSGEFKRRYTLPIEGSELTFEMDAYFKEDGKLSDYVRFELEVQESLKNVPSLPHGVEIITDKTLINSINENVFRVKHK